VDFVSVQARVADLALRWLQSDHPRAIEARLAAEPDPDRMVEDLVLSLHEDEAGETEWTPVLAQLGAEAAVSLLGGMLLIAWFRVRRAQRATEV
jgi:hypothetical protein